MDYRSLAYQTAQKYGINPDLFVRQIQAESAFNPAAVSSAGAIGLGQLMPATAKELGVDPTDPAQNLDGAARYMKQLLGRYKGNQTLALAAYNAGMGNVDKAGGVPNFKETQNYIAKIMGSNMAQQPTQPNAQGFLGGLLGGQGIGGALGLSDDMRDKLRMGILAGSDPRAFAQQIQAAQQSITARRQERQKQAGRNATADYLDSIGQGELAKLLRAGGINASTAFGAIPKAGKTYQYQSLAADLLRTGVAKTEAEALQMALANTKAGTTVNVGPQGQAFGNPPKDTVWKRNPDGTVFIGENGAPVALPISGSKTAIDAANAANAEEAKKARQATSGMTVLKDIRGAIELAKENPTLTTGFIGSILRNVGGTDALDLQELTESVRANIGFDRLDQMRKESPTGGALGQVAVQELKSLQASLGSLNTAQSDKQLVRNLERLEEQYRSSMLKIYQAAKEDNEKGLTNKITGEVISPFDYFSQSDINMLTGSGQGGGTRIKFDAQGNIIK